MRSSPAALAGLLLGVALAAPLAADPPTTGGEGFEVRALPAPGSDPWQPLHFPKVSRHTHYSPQATGAVVARSDCAASGLTLQFDPPLTPQQRPRLRWRWRVDSLSPSTADERSKAGDDFPARVYAIFDFDAANSSLWERTQRRIAGVLYGDGLPGTAVTYVWSRRLAVDSEWQSPYSRDTWMRALRAGPADGWQTESVDPYADHERLFGRASMPLRAIALMTDSDDGCGDATARYSDFELLLSR